MGNSLLDIIVFGRNAGKEASAKSKDVTVGALTLEHINKFENEIKEAGIATDSVSPKLLPTYTHGNPRFESK
jgi:succinate dehydrogenase / fumarate reductase flavoprotein subunit